MELLTISSLIMITLSKDIFEYFFNHFGFGEIEALEKEFNKF